MTTDYSKNLNYKLEGRRKIGRPQTRWGVDFREKGRGQGADDDDDDDEENDMKKVFNI